MRSPMYNQLCQSTEHKRLHLFNAPMIQAGLNGSATRAQYLAFLSQAYHHVRHTVPLLMACGSRLWPRHQHLQAALAEYIEEEQGHEQWILNDIDAAGGNAEAVKHSTPHLSTECMVAYAYHQIDRCNPVGFFGMVHVLEGTSTALATQVASALQAQFKLPDQAFTYLNSHGQLDLKHVEFFKNTINTLTHPDDQKAVVQTATAMYSLYRAMLDHLPVLN